MIQRTPFAVHPAWQTPKSGPLQAHQGMGWKPVPLPFNPRLGQVSPGTAKAVAMGALLLPTAAAAAVSYVGFRLGTQDQGFPSILGYVVGALAGISAVMGVLAVLGVATLPFNLQPQTTEMTVNPTA